MFRFIIGKRIMRIFSKMKNEQKLLQIALSWVIFSMIAASLTFGAATLNEIKILGEDAFREVILCIEGSYNYRYFELEEPDRLVIDIDDISINNPYSKEVESSYLKRIRAAQHQVEPQVIGRIVFDLKAKTPYRISYKEGNLSIVFHESETKFPTPLAYYTKREEIKNVENAKSDNLPEYGKIQDSIKSEEPEDEEGKSNEPELVLEAYKVQKPFEQMMLSERDYRIGCEDLLEIKVFDIPQFNNTVRVSENGTISLPLIGTVRTNNLTKRQLENKISELLSKFVHNPQVNIFIKEAESKKISVSGAVKKPGIYEMLLRQRLLDMISKAGGFTDEIGKELFVYRNDESGNRIRIPIDIERVLYYGEPDLNIEIKPGDVIFVPLEIFFKIYVNGAVKSPGSFDIKKSESITVHQAITIAGSTTDRAAEHKTQILRRLPEGKSEIIKVNLKKIKKGKAEDILLKNGDIVYVPEAFF